MPQQPKFTQMYERLQHKDTFKTLWNTMLAERGAGRGGGGGGGLYRE